MKSTTSRSRLVTRRRGGCGNDISDIEPSEWQGPDKNIKCGYKHLVIALI